MAGGEPTRRRSFTKTMSSLFKSKKKKENGDADSSRAASAREEATPDEPVAAPVERPSTAPTKAAEPGYASNYAAESAPAEPPPAVDEPTPAPSPVAAPAPDEAVAAPAPDEAVAAPIPDEPVAAPEPATSSSVTPPPADLPAGPTAEEQGGEAAADEPLDPGWEEVEAEDGRVYYWNEDTDGTTWDRGSISRRGSLQPGAPSLGSHAPSRKASLVSSVGSECPTLPSGQDTDTDTDDPDTEPEEVPADEPGALPGALPAELPEPVAATAYTEAVQPEPEPDAASGPSLADRQRAFESGSAYQPAAAPGAGGSRRGSANQEKVKALQKAGIQDDPNKVHSASNSQHKLAMAALDRKKERIEAAGTAGKGNGTSQMSAALKGLAAAQERPGGPSQHSQAMERLNRTSEVTSGGIDQGAYSGRAKPELVNSSNEGGGNQMQQAKAALALKNQEEERRGTGSMKEEAMRKLNGKGVVSTKEAFQTKSKSGTQHNAAMAAFSQIDGTDMTTGGPKKSQLRGSSSGKPMQSNKGLAKDGSQTQRAAAMAAFQTQGKEV